MHAVLAGQGLDQVLQGQVPAHIVAHTNGALHLQAQTSPGQCTEKGGQPLMPLASASVFRSGPHAAQSMLLNPDHVVSTLGPANMQLHLDSLGSDAGTIQNEAYQH